MQLHSLGALVVLAATSLPTTAYALAPASTTAAPTDDAVAPEGPTEDVLVEAEVEDHVNPVAEALRPVPNGLTSEEVARRAVMNSPEVGIKQAEIAKAAAQLDQTMIQFFPIVSGTAGYNRLSPAEIDFDFGSDGAQVGAVNEGPLLVGPCPQDPAAQCVVDSGGVPVGAVAVDNSAFMIEVPLNSWSLQAKLAVPLSDYALSLLPARRGSVAQKEAAQLAHDAEVIKVETDARLAYYDWVRASAAGVVATEAVTRNQQRLEDVQSSFEAGVASKADVLRFDSLVATSEALVVDAQTAEQLTAQRLAVIMGDAQEQQPIYSIGEEILGAPADVERVENLARLVDEAHQNRLELRSLYKSTDAVEFGIKATRAQYFPRLDAFAQATYANPNQRFFPQQQEWNGSWMVGAQISYTINDSVMTRAKIREYKADKRTLELTAEQLRRGVTMEVTQAYLDRKRALANIVLDTRRVEAAEEAYRVATDLFRVGQATTTDIIVAEADLVNSELQAINSRIDLRAANARLLYATGRLEPSRVK